MELMCKFCLSVFFLFFSVLHCWSDTDLEALTTFKAASDTSNKLTNWNTSTNHYCNWYGVSCLQNRVSRLVLEDLQLTGTIQPLTSLTHLRVLSLKTNRFYGSIPDLSNLTALKLLFLSDNYFSGQFPPSLPSLFRLDLSHNNFSGQIPFTLNRLTHLLTLRLEDNAFDGTISDLNLPNLQDLNVSGNRLNGRVPETLSGFPPSAFSGNAFLCGSPLPNCTDVAAGNKPATTVASSPMPAYTVPIKPTGKHSGKISPLAIVAIIVGDVLVLGIVSLLLYCYFWRINYSGSGSVSGENKNKESIEKMVYSSSPYPIAMGQQERGKMVFFEGARKFELEDLLRASAEMLGKGGFGTAYKAVLDDGNVVAVKRLKEAMVGGKREFEQHMEILGRLRHANIVSLKAYYFARDDKLLVYDYMPNGNLFWLLHGNRGPGRSPLDWTTRLKIAAGSARGLAYIHTSCTSLKLTHGNIKSTNILLDSVGNPRVSDFGLTTFAHPSTAPRSNGYRSPDARKFNQKSDIYSFGVLLLELLTGKSPSVVENGVPGGVLDLPRWVQSVVREEWTAEVFDLELMRYRDIEEEMVDLLQIALACTAASPDQRPTAGQVVKMIEEIRGVEVSPSHESVSDVSDGGTSVVN